MSSTDYINQWESRRQEFVSLVSEKNIEPSYVFSHSALACTWSTSDIYLAGEERIIDARDCVQDLVGHFIDAYESVNPRK